MLPMVPALTHAAAGLQWQGDDRLAKARLAQGRPRHLTPLIRCSLAMNDVEAPTGEQLIWPEPGPPTEIGQIGFPPWHPVPEVHERPPDDPPLLSSSPKWKGFFKFI